jgi:hypothetical protein
MNDIEVSGINLKKRQNMDKWASTALKTGDNKSN